MTKPETVKIFLGPLTLEVPGDLIDGLLKHVLVPIIDDLFKPDDTPPEVEDGKEDDDLEYREVVEEK